MRLEGRAAIVTGAASGIGRVLRHNCSRQRVHVSSPLICRIPVGNAHDGSSGISGFETDITDADAPGHIVGAAVEV